MSRLVLVALVFALAGPILSFAQDVDDPARAPGRARRALAATQKYRDAGDHERAAAMLLETVADHPEHDHHLLRLHLALSLRHLEREAEALEHLDVAVTLESNSRDVHLTRASAALAVESYAKAAESLEAAWALAPDEGADLLHDATVARLLADEMDAAVALAGRFLDEAPVPSVEQLRTVVTAAMQGASQPLADRAADRTIAVHAADADAWILVSQVRQSSDDLVGAAAALEAAHWLRPLEPAERSRLGDLLFASGVPGRAADHYAEAYGPTPDPDQAERLASALFASHRHDEAATVLTAVLATEPSARLWALLGDVHLDAGRIDSAAEAFGESLALDPDSDAVRSRLEHCEHIAE